MGKPASTDDLLATAFAQLPANSIRCPMGQILDDASDVARTRIRAALDAEHVSINWIVTTLRAAGRSINKDTVSNHRHGKCRCVRSQP